ncbi:hypothetical protein VIGAN_08337200 [Vigna angularis var. angularis]|uniref:Uncharacterized protein n=1 Tax=Vigna angularis var. angularis TaxID=157739 RepID=A0A0S3SUB9_PHAAN|nr:hypothetical protein VIGAN_08337200 [Vigna angularis var. angularis]
MGNKSSAPSNAEYSSHAESMSLKEPAQHHHHHHVVPNRINFSSRPKGYQTEQQHGKKALGNDEAFSTYIKDSKFKMKSKSNVGGHEDRSNAVPVDVANESNDRNKDYEKDHFSDFIANARKKLRTVTRRNSSVRRG